MEEKIEIALAKLESVLRSSNTWHEKLSGELSRIEGDLNRMLSEYWHPGIVVTIVAIPIAGTPPNETVLAIMKEGDNRSNDDWFLKIGHRAEDELVRAKDAPVEEQVAALDALPILIDAIGHSFEGYSLQIQHALKGVKS